MACFRSPDVDVSGSQERCLLTDQVQTDRQVVVRQGGQKSAGWMQVVAGIESEWHPSGTLTYVSRPPRVNFQKKKKRFNI